mgnify:CR=1 FL=1|jgi:hypothetical protein
MAIDELNEKIDSYFLMSILGCLGVYFIIESGIMKYRPLIGHASGITVILGIFASFITWLKIHSWNMDAADNDKKTKIIIKDL